MTFEDQINAYIGQHGGYWEGEDPLYPVADWQMAVADGDTRRSYWEWAFCCADDSEGT